jgi:hypothetical protein
LIALSQVRREMPQQARTVLNELGRPDVAGDGGRWISVRSG